MTCPKTIALDGPAGSGKSTIGGMLAARLGYTFVDAGQLYRAIAHQVLLSGVEAADEEAVSLVAERCSIEVYPSPDNNRPTILIQGEDLARQDLHNEEINLIVPIVASYSGVRRLIRATQHRVAQQGNVVLAGRDIGTVVLPQAELKIFLDVSMAERVRRRYQSTRHIAGVTEQQVLEDLQRRDGLDSARPHSPLRAAADAVKIRTDGMEPAEVVDQIMRICQQGGTQGLRTPQTNDADRVAGREG